MVLDTKWKKFKFSNANKLLCVLLACVMVSVFMCNAVSLVKYIRYNESRIDSKSADFYDTHVFNSNLSDDIIAVISDVTNNAREENRQKKIEAFLKHYREEEPKWRLSDAEVLTITYSQSEYSGRIDGYVNSGYLPDGRGWYQGNDGYYYTKYMLFEDQSLVDADDDDKGINFGHTDEEAESLISSYLPENRSGYSYGRNYEQLKNIRYYAVCKDKILTNATEATALVKSVNSGEGDYIYYDSAKNFKSSDNLADFYISTFDYYDFQEDYSVYISINPEFSEDDIYKDIYESYQNTSGQSLGFIAVNIIVSAVLLIALAVVSCRIAGHKDGTVSMSGFDKFPADLHFIIMGSLVGSAGCGILMIISNIERVANNSGINSFEARFFYSNWFYAAMCAGGILIWLMLLNFAVSVSRAVKAGYPVLRKLLTVRIIVGIYKLIVWTIRGITGYAFRPKKLHKRSVPAVVLYTLFNIISLLIIALLFAMDDSFAAFCAFLGIIAMLGIDAYVIRKAVKYMKSLDDIIDASEKRQPLPYNTDKLPASLKILADSLESTNEELNKAVLKAVKDERTKTELITNVSHDLKTPLTSVINYIDLLRKCDIDNEEAVKYMQVIAEKSGKLKRLIEDLIEASKVSSGNVTLNKTLINLNELAMQAVVEETADIEKNNLQVIFEESADRHIVFADGTKIYRVFENLLSNARKYSAPGSRVYVRVYSDNSFGYFEIKNISKEQLNISAEELTERFVRGDQSRSQDGNGLGLSIAKELCRLNGGELIISIDGDLFKATVKLPKNR